MMMRSRSILSLATAASTAASLILTIICHREGSVLELPRMTNTVEAFSFSAGGANPTTRARRRTILTTQPRCHHGRLISTRLMLSSTTVVVVAPTTTSSMVASMEADAEDEKTHRAATTSSSSSFVSDDVDGEDVVVTTNDVVVGDDAIIRVVGARVVGGMEDLSPHRRDVVVGGGNPSRRDDDNNIVVVVGGGGESVPTTWKKAFHRFFVGEPGPPLVILSISAFVFARMQLLLMTTTTTAMPYSLSEFAVFASSIIIWWMQEYFFHRVLLHSSPSFEWIGKSIHRTHHEKDYFHVSIDHPILLLGWLFVAHLVLRSLLPWHLCLSATVGYAFAGLTYEWSHYIVHTKVKPPPMSQSSSSSFAFFASRAFLRMRDNHIRHHRLDERYWYAFSVPAMDDLFGTNPDVKDLRNDARAGGGIKEDI